MSSRCTKLGRSAAALGVLVSLRAESAAATCAGASGVIAAIFGAVAGAECDVNGDGQLTIADVTALVRAGAPATATPTPSATAAPPATSTPAAVNHAPVVPEPGIYRTFPGFQIRRPIGATDPDAGQTLSHSPISLPEGAELDPLSGVLDWVPRANQLGPFYADLTVSDDGSPPQAVAARLVFAVEPLDACTQASCDPAAGCESTLTPLASPCCAGVLPIRVAAPLAGCPADRSVEIGRNRDGFGRLHNCDRFRLIASAQASVTVRINVRGRCLPVGVGVTIVARLEAHQRLLLDRRLSTTLQAGADGYAERLELFLPLVDATPELEGQEADLSVAVLLPDGAGEESKVRVVLTHEFLPDLPEL